MNRAKYKVGTRGSKLALARTQWVIDLLHSFDPGSECRIEIINTDGEWDDQDPADGSTGPFVADLEQALLDGRIDLAVHSAKDLPTEPTSGLAVAAYPVRSDPREALFSQRGQAYFDLPPGATVGTSSTRRRCQLATLRQDLHFVDLRGSLDRRIHKVRHGDCQATVVAHAGLMRLGLDDEAAHIFSLDMIIPAAGQGALALQCRHDDMRCFQLLELMNHQPTALAVQAERAVLQQLALSAAAPIGISASFPQAYAADPKRSMLLQAVLCAPDTGKQTKAQASGSPEHWHDLALNVADQLTKNAAPPDPRTETGQGTD